MNPEERHPETERVQAAILRRLGPSARLAQMRSLSSFVIRLSRRGLSRARPGASEQELILAFVELQYGRELADRVRVRMQAPPP